MVCAFLSVSGHGSRPAITCMHVYSGDVAGRGDLYTCIGVLLEVSGSTPTSCFLILICKIFGKAHVWLCFCDVCACSPGSIVNLVRC